MNGALSSSAVLVAMELVLTMCARGEEMLALYVLSPP